MKAGTLSEIKDFNFIGIAFERIRTYNSGHLPNRYLPLNPDGLSLKHNDN